MSRQHLESSIFGEHPEEHAGQQAGPRTAPSGAGRPGPGRGGPGAAARARARRRRGGRRLLVLLTTLAVVAVAGFVAVTYLKPLVSGIGASQDYEGEGSGSVLVTVNRGDTGRTIAQTLFAAGVVKTAKAFADRAEASPDAAGIQPGRYTLRRHMSAAAALSMLLDPANKSVPRVTIREGLWAPEVFALLSKATGVPLGSYQAALKDPQAIGLPAAAKGNVEGYLFPDSYEFEPNASATTQLRTLVSKSVAELVRLKVPPASYERVITVASIVEAEARRAADRPKVARVLENRLAARMNLQLDSTISYLLKKRGKITTTDAERLTASPYNTYLNPGLPAGPIGNPGRSSIEAAVRPAAGPWLYFVAVNPQTGETRFNTDQAGHDADAQVFQAWCRAHPGTC
ncbi:MAG TPA: endolytic transglycosylase MltG [Dermatophilaceae bacterium]|nr:endolytic transglycosylase MltG [Dermatophilaceae bacterium]